MEILDEINRKSEEKKGEIENWIDEQCRKVSVPLYTSVDLRISQHKITPVDTNVFPAGFNNLCSVFRERASNLFREYLIQSHPGAKKILIIPELHTRNPHYWENIYVIKSILERVDFLVEVGLVSDELYEDEVRFKTVNGEDVVAFRLQRDDNTVFISGFTPDLILINNDFSSKCPKILRDVRQPVEPPVEIGWHTRRKNVHFDFYNKLAREVAELIGIDPWIITIKTVSQNGVDFDDPEDREKVAQSADAVLDELRGEYTKRGIRESPFLFVKSNSGTYGMAVINVFRADEVRTLNAEGRKQMRVSKGGKPVRDVVVQEGIPTTLRVGHEAVGEPVVYLIKAKTAGGFLRLNRGKSEFDNLNTRGMEFSCLSLHEEDKCRKGECNKFFPLAYQLIARTATIAAGYEIEKILKEGGCGDKV